MRGVLEPREASLPTEQDIRDLCRRVEQAQDQTEFETALLDLQIMLHFRNIENLGIEYRTGNALLKSRKPKL